MRSVWTYLVLPLFPGTFFAQENLELYRGNSSFEDGKFEAAKTHYEKALNLNPASYKGTYNIGNTAYRLDDFEDATAHYQQALANSTTNAEKAQAYHNLGNAHLQSGKPDEAINAYKNALRLDPQADDTRYNLAYAQKMKKKQEQEQQEQNQDKDQQDQDQQEKDKEENQDKQDKQEDQDRQNEEEKDSEQDDKEQPGKDNEEQQDKGGQPDEKEQPAKPLNLSPREAEQMLEAARNEDQKVLMQLHKKDQKAQPKHIEKDW